MAVFTNKTFPAALLSASLLAGSAVAQTATLVEVDDDAMIAALDMEADDVDDADVFDAAGTEVGEVEEVVGTDAMTPTALVVEFDVDAYGGEDRLIPLEHFSMQNDRLTLSLDAAAVAGMTVYED
jgi:hypothetical protein